MKITKFFARGEERYELWEGHDGGAKAKYLTDKVVRFLPDNPSHCDIACGTGFIMSAFSDIGCKTRGLEIDRKFIRACKKRGLDAVYGDITQTLPFDDQEFNVISLISILEHLREPQAAVAEFDRILAPGGIFVIQIPNPHFPVDLHYFLPFFGYLPERVRNIYHRIFIGDKYGLDYYTAQMKRREVRDLMAQYESLLDEKFSYPAEVAPHWARPVFRFFSALGFLKLFPTGFLFVYRKP